MDRHLKWERVGTGPGVAMVATLLDSELTDPTTIDAVGLCLIELIEQEGCRNLALDCAAVRFASSSFLSKVIKLNRMMAALGGWRAIRKD